MPTIGDISAGISNALSSITGLRTVAYLSDSVNPPVAMVAIEDVNYHGAFNNGLIVYTFTVWLVLSRSSDRVGIQSMESYMSDSGPMSILAACEADRTFGGIVDTSLLEKSGPPVSLSIGGTPYISVPFTVIVQSTGE